MGGDSSEGELHNNQPDDENDEDDDDDDRMSNDALMTHWTRPDRTVGQRYMLDGRSGQHNTTTN